MRTIIFGGRDFNDYEFLKECMDLIHSQHTITLVIGGEARGADTLGKRWALENNIPFIGYVANWDLYGKSAGYKRNVQMAEHPADLGVGFPGGKGTQHMIDILYRKNIKTIIIK